jgi:hypothetical protein
MKGYTCYNETLNSLHDLLQYYEVHHANRGIELGTFKSRISFIFGSSLEYEYTVFLCC